MKNLFLTNLLFFLLVACQQEYVVIKVTNSLDFDRREEMVEVNIRQLNVDFAEKKYLLNDHKGQEIAYQLLRDNNQVYALIFQADIPAHSSVEYKFIEGTPAEVTSKTHARYVPERKDDFAWENDLSVYRMYGPALAGENPSNGVDLWLKRTADLIVDKFYHDELVDGLSYHVDHGLGLDCYTVGHTLGAGGIAPYTDKLWIGDHYNRFAVIENGPLRSVFALTYDSVKVSHDYYTQTITITVDAGSLLNKAVVRYEGANQPMKLAGGIVLHNGEGDRYTDPENQLIAYAENAVSNAGIASGRNYVGVYLPQKEVQIKEEANHLLIMNDYKPGTEFVYYFGGGWSQWHYPTDKAWFDAMVRFSQTKTSPLQVVLL
ncbi:DUF4861 family protein [Parabacteroides sp. PF5-9]|uniref:DUF4861 family protein n=1 Tax=Parabacteroides sp. PF5-9 TaxID=1742404 RepID=UPI002474ECCB|nr:DUF4861 family protein [Parabacteroides sp. PF5-9]